MNILFGKNVWKVEMYVLKMLLMIIYWDKIVNNRFEIFLKS